MTFKFRTAMAMLLFAGVFGRSAQCGQMPDEPGIVTDRPDVTESSIVVPKGSVQFENGITWAKQRHDNAIEFSETLVRLELLNRTELRLVLPNYLADHKTSSAPSGFQEFGLRMALGPQPGRVLRLILREGMTVGPIGIGAGLLGALPVTRLMASLVYGVPLHDRATFVGVAIALTTVAFVACYIPAQRAAKVDCMVALRHE